MLMSNALKQEVHDLLDGASEERLVEVRAMLRVSSDPFADMSDEERGKLRASLARGRAQHEAGEGIELDEAMVMLRSRR